MTLASQIDKLKQRFHLDHVVLVGDRGMITQARITEDIKSAGLDWITALRAPAIKGLLESGTLQLSLFDQRDIASITAPEFPNERLVVCRNPDLAAERARKREDLLAATERDLARIQAAVARKRDPPRGTAEIALAVGAVVNRYKACPRALDPGMAKHFDLDITDAHFSFTRKTTEIAAEAASDGIYVVRTSLPAETFDDATTVRSYKSLAMVERAFRCIKTVDLQVRPVHHWLPDRVRAHVFLCMLAYYLEWHMRQRLAPMLFDDTDKEAAEALRKSVVAQAQRSPAAVKKQTTGLTEDGLPVHSFRSLLADLATLARNTIVTAITPHYPLTVLTRPTSIQQKAFDLLGIKCSQWRSVPPTDCSYNSADCALTAQESRVSGRPPTMTVMIGSSDAAFVKYQRLFEAIAANVFHVGPSGAATAKLVTQYLGYTNFIASIEGMLVAAKAGIDLDILA